MKLATTTADFGRFTRQSGDALGYVRAAGFSCVDYNFCQDHDNGTGVYGEDWEAYVKKTARKAQELGLSFVQAHAPMGRPIVDRAVNREMADATIRSVRAAADWGIRNVVVHSGYQYGLTVDETMELNRRFYAEILREAEKYDVNILTENFNRMCVEGLYWIDNASDLRRLIDSVDHPLFHACWDTGHANLQEMPQDREMRILGGHIRGLHINDNHGTGDDHIEVYSGTLNMDAVMHGLIDIGYDGYFTFESTNAIPRGAARRTYEADTRLFGVPLEVCIRQEEVKYAIGKAILSAYGLFEEA